VINGTVSPFTSADSSDTEPKLKKVSDGGSFGKEISPDESPTAR
jgi:hypothetical protein